MDSNYSNYMIKITYIIIIVIGMTVYYKIFRNLPEVV